MQLSIMDSVKRVNSNENDSELDDVAHDDHSDAEMHGCDLVEDDHVSRVEPCLGSSITNNCVGAALKMNGPDNVNDMIISHSHQFPPNHPLNALGNFMGISSLHGIPNFSHTGMLEKLKMQVRDMNVGLMDKEYTAAHAAAFGANILPTSIGTAFTLTPTTVPSFTHAAQTLIPPTANNVNPLPNTNSSSGGSSNGNRNKFSFTSPTAPSIKDVNPASNSSTSSETSNSSQQNSGWSFEEQYKQVRQLYEINDDPKRKEFLDDLFSFMQKRGTPINRLPIMAKSVLDLYELYNLVIARGGLVDVINKKLWQEIIKGLHLPSSITSAAFTLRTQYMKYLYPYECEKKNLSTPTELQAAIDGNRREGRRSSYGQYEAMHNQMQMPQIARQSLTGGMQQMSPLALVTHAANSQQAQAAAAAAAAHHRLMAPSFGQVPNLVTQEIEQRMIEYLKLIQVKKEQNTISNGSASVNLSPRHQHHQQQEQRQRSESPEVSTREALSALEMSRAALWQMYHNNTSPPASANTSPQRGNGNDCDSHGTSEAQRVTFHINSSSEILNILDSNPNFTTIKRERECEPSLQISDCDDFHHQPPPAKRATSFHLAFCNKRMASSTNATNIHSGDHHYSNNEADGENNDEEGEHNSTINSFHDDTKERQQINGSSLEAPLHYGSSGSVNNERSDDSAIENSPSTSAVSVGNGHLSPVRTKKIHQSEQAQQQNISLQKNSDGICAYNTPTDDFSPLNPSQSLNLLTGMQFRIARNGVSTNGDHELVVNLELNGIKYSGVLIANPTHLPTLATTTTAAKILPLNNDTSSNNTNIKSPISNENITNCSRKTGSRICANTAIRANECSSDFVISMDSMEDANDLTVCEDETSPNRNQTNSATTTSLNNNCSAFKNTKIIS